MMAPTMTPLAYPRPELSHGFYYEKYAGWGVATESERLKVLVRRIGPVRRYVLLADGAPDRTIADASRTLGLLSPRATLIAVDFAADEGADISESGVRRALGDSLVPVTERKWFGAGTFVFDLSKSDEALFSAIVPRERSKIRKSEKSGVTTVFTFDPDPEDLERFFRFYKRMADERGLPMLDEDGVRRMLRARDALLAVARDASGEARTLNVVYVTEEHGYYLHGTHDPDVTERGGHLLHWKTLQHLRSIGKRWYDFGLIATESESDGIYRFKKSFGGELVRSGRQFSHEPLWLSWAARAGRRARSVAREAEKELRRRVPALASTRLPFVKRGA
jgi:hypothetical protein